MGLLPFRERILAVWLRQTTYVAPELKEAIHKVEERKKQAEQIKKLQEKQKARLSGERNLKRNTGKFEICQKF